MALKVLHLSSECGPWAKTGGLGDVVGALPDALIAADPSVQAAVVLPLYRTAKEKLRKGNHQLHDTGVEAAVNLGDVTAKVRYLRLDRPGKATTFFAACDAAYDRDGLYGHKDDGLRFVLLCKATVGVATQLMGGQPDVLHAHDWHAALAPALIATSARALLPRTRTVLTLHNLAYQGVMPKEMLPITGLGWDQFRLEVAEWHDHLGLLKAGIALCDAVTTVSPTYAREIKTPEYGHQLDGFLRRFKVHGILNGIDTAEYDPNGDVHVKGRWTAQDLAGKQEARQDLLRICEWPDWKGVPTLGVVSRMTAQKGLDLIADLVPELHAFPARLVVLGTGEPHLEEAFRRAARYFQDHVRTSIAFDVPMSHKVIAGCDALLVPSRFEPCGLTQMYAMRLGTVPIVHATGGLADTVIDPGDVGLSQGRGTGFAFGHPTTQGLRWAVGRAARMYRHAPEAWSTIQRTGMGIDWSWSRSAANYLGLYRSL